MDTYDELNYVPLYTHKSSRSRILCATKSEKPCQFYVYNELRPSDQPIVASGVLSKDGTQLYTTYTMPNGMRGCYSYDYRALKRAVDRYESLDKRKGKR